MERIEDVSTLKGSELAEYLNKLGDDDLDQLLKSLDVTGKRNRLVWYLKKLTAPKLKAYHARRAEERFEARFGDVDTVEVPLLDDTEVRMPEASRPAERGDPLAREIGEERADGGETDETEERRAARGRASVRRARRLDDTSHLLESYYLVEAARRRRSVARLVDGVGEPLGTGFLVGPNVLLACYHTLHEALVAGKTLAQFDYVKWPATEGLRPRSHRLRPGLLFFRHVRYDFAIVYVDPLSTDALPGEEAGWPLEGRGWSPLSPEKWEPERDGEFERVNIIQHPGGHEQKVALRENQSVFLPAENPDVFLHYLAPTASYSSGSPVWDDDWDLVALHHARMGDKANEGVRVSRIARELRKRQRLHTTAFKKRGDVRNAQKAKWIAACFKGPTGVPVDDGNPTPVGPIRPNPPLGPDPEAGARLRDLQAWAAMDERLSP